MLVLLFGAEALVATLFLDGAAPVAKGSWLAVLIHSWGAWVARFGIAFSALFATFAFLRYKAELESFCAAAAGEPIRWSLLAAHFAAIGLFSFTSIGVYGDRLPALDPNLVAASWIFAAVAAIATAGLAFLPWQFWTALTRTTGWLSLYAAAAAVVTCVGATTFRSLWRPASRV